MPFNETADYTIVKNKNKFGITDNKGNVISPLKYSYIAPLSPSGLAIYSNGQKYGYLDENGKVAIHAGFDAACNFVEDYAFVKLDKIWSLINKQGLPALNFVKLHPKHNPALKDTDSIAVFNESEISRDSRGNSLIVKDGSNGDRYFLESSANSNEKYLLINANNTDSEYGFIRFDRYYGPKYSIRKEHVNEAEYLVPLGSNLARYRLYRLYGIADQNGKLIFEPKFENIDYYKDNIYIIFYRHNLCYLRTDGSWIWKPQD